jgi:DNA-binding transcriptional MerR regulator
MAPSSQGMRIAELARRSGTSKETIHFYLREGLLRKPKKTSRNMAYYDESHVEQLKLIKRLRTESYLPLHVIKKVLKEGKLASSARNLDLAGELFGQGARTEFEPLTREDLAERTKLSEQRIAVYEEAGLLRPKLVGKTKHYGHEDVRVAELLHAAEAEAGPGGEQLVLERFAILERHMTDLVRDEVSHFFSRVVSEGDPRRALELLRGGRETIGRYLALARARRLRDEVESMMPAIESAIRAQVPERFYLPLLPEQRAKTTDATRRKALLDRFERRPEDTIVAHALFEHLVVIGDTKEMLEQHAKARGRARDGEVSQRWLAEALIGEQRSNDAITILDKLRDGRDEPDMLLEALWGATILIRLRINFPTLSSSTELIGYITRAFSAFDLVRALDPPNRFVSARAHLLLGRVCFAVPEFLGMRRLARLDLERCLEDVRSVRESPPAVELEHTRRRNDPALLGLLNDFNWGGLDRIELNAKHFLARID